MKKVISTILAMAMVLSMTAAFATIDPVDFAGFDVESTCIYDNDFDAELAAPFSGLDLDVEAKPTKWEYVERATGDMAVKVWHETVPTYDEVLENLPTKPENEDEIEEGVTYKEDYTEAMYKAWYKENGYVAITGDKRAITSGTDAYVLDFDIYFPVIPEHGAFVNIWNGMKQNGVRAVKPFLFSYVDTVNEDNEVVEEGTVFGFASGNELIKEIEAETWYDCTQVVDIAERYIHYYINGELVNTVDIAAAGPITDRGYVRAVYAPFGLEEGFYLDNVHIYEANAEEVFVGNPYSYIASGNAPLDFEGYTIDTALKDADGNAVTQLGGQAVGLSGAANMSLVADPTGESNKVLKWDNTNGDAAADLYLIVGTAAKYEINDKVNNAIVFSTDVYVEEANDLGSTQIAWFTAYTPVRVHRQPSMSKADADTVKISYGGQTATFPEKEWHNFKWVYEMGTNTAYMYLDDVPFYEASLENGPYYNTSDELVQESGFYKLEYIRTQMSKTTKGVVYFDNWHVYEGTKNPVAIKAVDYVAGESLVGSAIALEASSYVAGQAATIEMSADGVNWAAFTGTAATLTASTVYYRAKVGDFVTEPILLYGVAGPELVQRAEILNVDFETKNGISYGIAENETGFDNLITTDGETETIVRSAETGTFSVETKAATVDAAGVATGNYRTTEVANAPAGYANAANIGATALKITGNGEKTAGAISQIYINLCGKGNTYPGGADNTNSGVQDGDIYVTEFDYAYDAAVDKEIQVVSYRAKWNATGTSYYAISMSADGTLKCANKATSTVLAPKTWYNIKVVAHYATGTVDVYVNDILVNTQTSSTGSLGMWESFRLWGDRAAAAVSDVVYYDNMNFYIAQAGEVPTASGMRWNLDDDGILTITGNGDMADGLYPWYSHKNNIEKVVIGDGITSIGARAFEDYDNLASVIISDSVISIGAAAFGSCDKLASITIPDGVTGINDNTFNHCTGLTNIIIPKSVTSIGDDAFFGCEYLEDIYYNGTETDWDLIQKGKGNVNLRCATLNCFWYLNIYNTENNFIMNLTVKDNSKADISEIEEVDDIWNRLYTDRERTTVFDQNIPITKNMDLYLGYSTNRYTYKFVNDDGTILASGTLGDGDVIVAPPTPVKSNAEEGYIYTFEGWFTEDGVEFVRGTEITKDIVFYATYTATVNQYSYKFVDEDGTVLKEATVDYDTVLTPPKNPTKASTQQYTYTFTGWDGFTEGITQKAEEMVFTATYTATVNQYTYKFIDEDGTILKEEKVDYGTSITPPEITDKTEYYVFDYWHDYTEGVTLTDDVTFKAVFKYKEYSITAEGLAEPVTVTYNSNFTVEPQKIDDYHYFIGYFTEKDGKGEQITNENGESLSVYNIIGNLTIYPYFYEGYMNKIELQGDTSAMPGDVINQKVIFATDKDAKNMSVTIKYPKFLSYKNVAGADFIIAAKGSEKTEGDFKILTIDCMYDFSGNAIPINKNLVPFELELDVLTDAPIGDYEIAVDKAALIGGSNYEITDFANSAIEITPKLAESIEIVGVSEIDKKTQYTAVVIPDYTTDKSVIWSVDNEAVATISQDGILTPISCGDVKVIATTKDGSGASASKSVKVIAYAQIEGLDFGEGVSSVEFNSDIREYTVYVNKDTETITLTPTYFGGYLVPNGEGIWFTGSAKTFNLTDIDTIITLSRKEVSGMLDSDYTIRVIKSDEDETLVSADGKKFVIRNGDLNAGDRVFLALYYGDVMVDIQTAIYDGEIIIFTTETDYTNVKVMVWDNLSTIKPICGIEIVK